MTLEFRISQTQIWQGCIYGSTLSTDLFLCDFSILNKNATYYKYDVQLITAL